MDCGPIGRKKKTKKKKKKRKKKKIKKKKKTKKKTKKKKRPKVCGGSLIWKLGYLWKNQPNFNAEPSFAPRREMDCVIQNWQCWKASLPVKVKERLMHGIASEFWECSTIAIEGPACERIYNLDLVRGLRQKIEVYVALFTMVGNILPSSCS